MMTSMCFLLLHDLLPPTPSIFLSAIKVCRQQIVQWILSCNLRTILFANLFYQSMCWLLPCLVLYNSVSANCHQHKTIWWHGSGNIVYWITIANQKRKFALLKLILSFSSFVVGLMKKGQSFAIRCFWYQKKYNICDQLHTPACQNFSHLFRIGHKSVVNQTDSVG